MQTAWSMFGTPVVLILTYLARVV